MGRALRNLLSNVSFHKEQTSKKKNRKMTYKRTQTDAFIIYR